MFQPADFATRQMQFASERLRLLGALGELTAGGIVEGLQPIGATTAQGIPLLAPEIVLLFKSKNTSFNKKECVQDQIDFDAVQAHLDAERRAWLRWALFATEPKHPWIERLI